jgi:hypothetical protein
MTMMTMMRRVVCLQNEEEEENVDGFDSRTN